MKIVLLLVAIVAITYRADANDSSSVASKGDGMASSTIAPAESMTTTQPSSSAAATTQATTNTTPSSSSYISFSSALLFGSLMAFMVKILFA